MTVKELKEKLNEFPDDYEVGAMDGHHRMVLLNGFIISDAERVLVISPYKGDDNIDKWKPNANIR